MSKKNLSSSSQLDSDLNPLLDTAPVDIYHGSLQRGTWSKTVVKKTWRWKIRNKGGDQFEKPTKNMSTSISLKGQELPALELQIPGKIDFQNGNIHYWIGKYNQALYCFQKSAQHQYPLSLLYLGIMYKEGLAVAKDKLTAEHYLQSARKHEVWFKSQAELDDPESQFYLGQSYEWVEKDTKQAVIYYQKAADQGNAAAQLNLGLCYQYGLEVSKDEKRAAAYYQKAAVQGHSVAQYHLGLFYQNGIGGITNEKQAVEWLQKSADGGNADAQTNLGWCYQNGIGVVKDKEQAAAWYQKAADQGNALAQQNLGKCYQKGIGVVKDEKRAVEWYQKAAAQGNSLAQINLGWCYEHGIGVNKKNEKKAEKWYGLATLGENGSVQTRLKKSNVSSSVAQNPHGVFGNRIRIAGGKTVVLDNNNQNKSRCHI